jgi:hypothetical protein
MLVFSNTFSQTSYIQIVSEPGISVFLDGAFKGTTTVDLGGLIIRDVAYGGHLIKVVKEGYLPQEESITIKAGEVFTYQVNKNFIPRIQISESGNKENQAISIKKGNLKLQSLPIAIQIIIPGLGIDNQKTQDEWLAKDIPEGKYKATYKWNNTILEDEIEIMNGMVSYAFVNMIDGKIERKRISPIDGTSVMDMEMNIRSVNSYSSQVASADNQPKEYAGLFSMDDSKPKKFGTKVMEFILVMLGLFVVGTLVGA